MAISLITEETAFGLPDTDSAAYLKQAMDYLAKSVTAQKLLKTLEGGNYDVAVLVQKDCYSMFVHAELAEQQKINTAVIVWDPVATVTAFNDKLETMQSPAIGLAHEMGHAAQWVSSRGWYLAYVNQALQGNQKSKLLIENDNITTWETPVAKELGEGTRKDYNTSANFAKAQKNYKCPYRLLPLGH